MPATTPREIILHGGTTNRGLVSRVGDTVRRPLRPTSAATKALLDHLNDVGFQGAPRYLGVDDSGREVLTYIPGEAPIAPTPAWALTDDALVSVAELLRDYHLAAAGFDPSGHDWPHPIPERFRHGLISHNDPNLDNIVFRDGRAVALIDFDLASPGSAVWDLACTARLWVPLRADEDLPAELDGRMYSRLALFADAYGATPRERTQLVDAVIDCHRWCYRVVQDAVASGHETFRLDWRTSSRMRTLRTSRWLAGHTSEMLEALGVG